MDAVAPHLLYSQHGELNLVSSTSNGLTAVHHHYCVCFVCEPVHVLVCVCPIWQVLDCNRINFSVYCAGFPTYWWVDAVVTCGRPRMAGRVTEGGSDDEGRGGRSVTGVHGSVMGVQNESVTGGKEI